MIEFVKKTAERAQFVTSHCDGAFVLAKAGLLDGMSNQQLSRAILKLCGEMFPGLKIHEDVLICS